mmetsp:Transcript_111213/g.295561  ORF Transcript_111213/g.295561 Transcript_111213/m.295561 type:complete len:236 (-) Transcript_111213:2028-2735(-)
MLCGRHAPRQDPLHGPSRHEHPREGLEDQQGGPLHGFTPGRAGSGGDHQGLLDVAGAAGLAREVLPLQCHGHARPQQLPGRGHRGYGALRRRGALRGRHLRPECAHRAHDEARPAGEAAPCPRDQRHGPPGRRAEAAADRRLPQAALLHRGHQRDPRAALRHSRHRGGQPDLLLAAQGQRALRLEPLQDDVHARVLRHSLRRDSRLELRPQDARKVPVGRPLLQPRHWPLPEECA